MKKKLTTGTLSILAVLIGTMNLYGQSVKKMVEVNTAGNQIGQPLTSVQLKPYEVKFIEMEF